MKTDIQIANETKMEPNDFVFIDYYSFPITTAVTFP